MSAHMKFLTVITDTNVGTIQVSCLVWNDAIYRQKGMAFYHFLNKTYSPARHIGQLLRCVQI